jgi:hypothetical protein
MTETADQMREARAWDRRPEEPSLWYERFLIYCNLGQRRSIAAAYRRYRALYDSDIETDGDCKANAAPSTWYEYADRYDWLERATLYDDWLLAGADEQVRAVVRKWRIKATNDLADIWDDLAERWHSADDDMTKNQVSSAMKTTAKILSDTAPAGQTVQYNILLDKLPPELQETLAKSLDID